MSVFFHVQCNRLFVVLLVACSWRSKVTQIETGKPGDGSFKSEKRKKLYAKETCACCLQNAYTATNRCDSETKDFARQPTAVPFGGGWLCFSGVSVVVK